MGKEGRVRMDNEAKLRSFLEVDIPNLYDKLKEEVHSREAMEQRMLDKAMEEDIVHKVQGEIQQERSEREKTEEQLLQLLDQTCNKLCAAQNQHLVPLDR